MHSLRFAAASARRLPCPAPAWLLLFLAGCVPAGTSSVTTQPDGERIAPAPSPAPANSPPVALRPQEYWELISMDGIRVGHAGYRIAEVTENDRPLIRTTAESELVIERAGQSLRPKVKVTSWDTPEGELVRFETEQDAGGEIKRTKGRVVDGKLEIEMGQGAQTQTTQFAWKKSDRGPFGVEQAFRNQPLRSGEKRTITAFVPVINLPATTVVTAGDYEQVTLPEGPRKLLKAIIATTPLGAGPQQRIESTVWIDDAGEPLQSYLAGMKQLTQRVSQELALKEDKTAPKVDLIENPVVKLAAPLRQPLDTKRVVYRARVKEGSIEGLFAQGLSQRVKPIDSRTADIEVLAVTKDTPLPSSLAKSPPLPADLAPNALVEADDPRIQRMALGGGRANDPVVLATSLESLVHRVIQKKDFSQAFASAAETAKQLQGDCTEHAVLLAALARARKLPARTAIGLVYYPPKQGFAYHMWDEIWVGDRWLPFDATIGRGQVGADRLKLVDTNLQGASAYSAMLPVVRAFGRLELEVVSAE